MEGSSPAVVAEVPAPPPLLPEIPTSTTALVMDPQSMTNMLALAEVMASAVATIPQHLRKNRGDCLAIVMQSMQWGMNPFAVAQKTHTVNGVLGYEAQLVNAVIIARAPVKGRLSFEWFGDWSKIVGKFVERESKNKKDEEGEAKKYRMPAWQISDEAGLGVRVSGTFRGETEPRTLELLMTQARTRNSTLWADDPKQQLAYLAIKRWSRLYCPDVILGVYTADELEEIEPAPERDITPGREESAKASAEADSLRSTLIALLEKAAERGSVAVAEAWRALNADQRRTIPDREWKRIKELGASVDKARDAADAQPERAATLTYAELAEAIKTAADAMALAAVLERLEHLPADQQQELIELAKTKAQGFAA